MYKKIDNNRSLYFYEKYIDFFLRNYQEITIENIFRGQFEIKSYLELSKNIKYKFKELKDLSIRFADFISNNSNILFSQTNDNDLEDFANSFYEDFKMRFSHCQGNESKLSYLLYNLFHVSFCTEQFEIHKNKKDTFGDVFFFTKTSSDHMGFLHSVNNNSEFNFFRTKEEIINSILVYLDEDLNWVSAATPIILENISNLSILEGYKSQSIKAINSFLNQEYIEFMYIGPAIIERILKNYLIEIDGNVKTFRIDTVVDKTLNQIIEELLNDNNCRIDKYLLKYFAYILVNSDGLNLRNLVLHGNCQDNVFNKYNSMYIYIILIYLIRFFSKNSLIVDED